jgi:uncharacterized small protein (DUF1192 family)
LDFELAALSLQNVGVIHVDLDDPPKPKLAMVIGESLETVSLAELEHRIKALEVEIVRVQDEINRKQASKSAADAFFKN